MRILITGASGLLGLNLALEAAKEHTVYGVVHQHPIDFRLAGEIWPGNYKPFEIIRADLRETRAAGQKSILGDILDARRPDWIVHCAALADLDACEADPPLAHALNAELPEALARHAVQRGVRLAHISTDAVFDGRKGEYTEADDPNPLSVYARTKLEGERAVLAADPQAVVLRVNLFGWSLTGRRSLAEFFFNNFRAGKSVMGFTDVHFCPLLVNDLFSILHKIFQRKLSGLYHLVSCDSLTKYQFGVALARQFGFDESLIRPASVSEAGLKAQRSPLLTLRTNKLARDLGEPMPAVAPALQHFHALYEQGYPQFLKKLAAGVPSPSMMG